MDNQANGGTAIVRWLKNAGIKNVFSVSGGPINPIYQACAHDGVQLVHARHEAAAGYMAEAAARVSGNPAALVVTLGPGVANTLTPAVVSNLGGTPLLIIGAQSATTSAERGAGMSFELLPAMRSVTKWAARCTDPNRLAEYLDIAWRKMWAGRPGPVFLEVPTDVLHQPISIGLENILPSGPTKPVKPGLSPADADEFLRKFSAAKRPILLLGDDTFYDPSEKLQSAIEKHGIPFFTLRLARGIVDERHPLCAGPGYTPCNSSLRSALQEADLIILLGHHFEFDLDFGSAIPVTTEIVQVAMDQELLHRNRRASLAIAASPSAFVELLAQSEMPSFDEAWTRGVVESWNAEFAAQKGEDDQTGLHPITAVDAVREAMPDNTIFVTSHGNIDFWADARLKIPARGRYLRAGQSGTLGAEVPYGAGANFEDPDAPVVVFVGDGGVGYHVTELDTAERYGRAFTIVVLDDQLWGAIALPQDMKYGETYAMNLPRRDWAKVAEGLGGKGFIATTPEEIASAVREAHASGKPAIVQVPVRSVLSPYMAYIS